MYNAFFTQQIKWTQNLKSKKTNYLLIQPIVFVESQQFIKIAVKQFKDYALNK